MKPRFLQFISLLLIFLTLLPLLPQAAASESGFYLAVFTENGPVIEPERISAEPNETIRQALLHSSHRFEGLEQGYIQAVDGIADSFYLAYDNGGYDLDKPASGITGMILSTRESPWTSAGQELLIQLGQFREDDSGVQNYPAAREAYLSALNALFENSGQDEAMAALHAAIAAYAALMDGEKATVSFLLTEGGEPVGSAQLTMIGQYGDRHTAQGTKIQVIPGEYTYEISARADSVTRGTITVGSENCQLAAALPAGNWFSEVKLLTQNDRENGYEREILGANSARFFIPDTAGSSSVFLNAVRGDVPDTAATRVWTDYIGINGTDYSAVSRSWNTTSAVLTSLLSQGMTGRNFRLEARYAAPEGYQMIQYYNMEILRIPTLSGLTLLSDGITLPLDFDSDNTKYTVSAASDQLTVIPEAFGAEGYRVTVGTQTAAPGESVQIPAASFQVSVSHESGTSRVYQVTVNKKTPVTITLNHQSGTAVEILNAAGSPIPAQTSSETSGTYSLIPGESYTYISSKGGWYHASATFTAAPGLRLTAAEPICQDWISALGTAQKNTSGSLDSCPYPLSPVFSPEVHSYDVAVSDVNTTFAAFVTLSQTSAKVTAEYSRLSTGAKESRTVSTGRPTGTLLPGLAETTGQTNYLSLKAAMTEGTVTYYQTYELTIRRQLHLYDCTLAAEGSLLLLQPEYDRDCLSYETDVPQGANQLALVLSGVSFGSDNGYAAAISISDHAETAVLTPEGSSISLPLDTAAQAEELQIRVTHEDPLSLPAEYSFRIRKLPPVTASFTVTPENAVVGLVDTGNGKRLWAGPDGLFVLLQGHSYQASVTCPGYLPQSLDFAADADKSFTVNLEPAPANDSLPTDMEAYWPDFRGNPENNAVLPVLTPINAEDAVLNWANALGEGYASSAVGCPILADGYIYTYAGTKIYKVDPIDGSVVTEGTMAGNSSFAINAPTYAEGMIFVGLANGRVQAFNAQTLESLWLYSDPLRGQPNCCITYRDGCIYTGFWNGETADANFVCLTVTDEDPANPLESKTAVWTKTWKGGYYWSGACIQDGHLLIGTDDGESGYLTGHASLLCMDPLTGRILDQIEMPQPGDIRCAISYDKATNAYYFTSKGGYFYRIRVEEDGSFAEDSFAWIRLSNGASNPSAPPMSTCTPVVYNGRAYIGVCGTAQFGAYSGHNITVLDLAAWKIAYSVPTQGYCQTSGLLTTAYAESFGKVYVYFFDNYTPGKLRMLEDSPGQTAASMVTEETYRSGAKEITADMAYVLFTPNGAQAQYAICSPICDETGTMYFKNDSGFLMALGPTIAELQITGLPRTVYSEGEVFDAAGMQITLVYSNGCTRDITNYVEFSDAPLTADDTEFMIRFEHTMYGNRDGEVGQEVYAPMAILNLTILTEADRAAAETVEVLIRDIPQPITLDSAEAIYAARAAYEALTDAQKALVGNYADLLEAERLLGELMHIHAFSDWMPDGNGCHTRSCACGETEAAPCDLAFGIVREASCAQDGLAADICSVCLWQTGEMTLPAFGHSFGQWHTLVIPTCRAVGVQSRECTVCGAEETQELPSFSCPSEKFSDVSSKGWYHRAVDDMLRRGIMSGTGSGTFLPTKTLSRAELVQVFYNMEGTSWESGETAFTDVSPKAWYAKAVAWASTNAIVNGTSPTTFGPKQSATREMVVTILYRYAGGRPVSENRLEAFADCSCVSGWAYNAVNWAVANGILNGSGGYLSPKKDITRAELAQLMMNYLNAQKG